MTGEKSERVSEWLDGLGRTAFDAYREHADEMTHDGKIMPAWDQLAPETRSHWEWSAMATIAAHTKALDVSRETSTGEETSNG